MLDFLNIFLDSFQLKLSRGWMENQTLDAFTLDLRNFFLPQFAPIQKASVLLLLSLRPETWKKSLRRLKEDTRELFDPSRISIVSSAY